MRAYLNAGFGSPLGPDMLSQIHGLGFHGVRQDLPPGRELELIDEFAPGSSGLRPLFLVNGGKMDEEPEPAGGRASEVALMMYELGVSGEIELGNEPNIARDRYSKDPGALALSIRTAWNVMQKDRRIRDTKLVVGGIMNTDRGGLHYLEECLRGVPPGVVVGFHTYRQHTTPDKPSKGFRTRADEFDRLQDIAAGRELWNTEIGWHTAKEKKHCWSRPKGLTDEEVFRRLEDEADYNAAAGARVFTTFQLNDGPGDGYESHFGIRYMDGTWKPSAQIAQSVRGLNA